MRNLFFIFLLVVCYGNSSIAQSIVSKANTDAITNFNGILGRFDYALSETEHLNVNYCLTPKSPRTIAHLMLNTPVQMAFNAKVFDTKGKVVLNWSPESKSHQYDVDLEVGSLSSGEYTIHIYNDKQPNSIYHFSFNKP